MHTIGVILAGCGRHDGSEVHESVLTLLYLEQNGATPLCMGQDKEQSDTINHNTELSQDENRNILAESSRISRGNMRDIKTVSADEIDGLILPGGAGAIKNLSNFAAAGVDLEVDPHVKKLVRQMVEAGKPVGAICIAPVTVVKILEDKKPEVTIGNDTALAVTIESMGGVHINCSVGQIHTDTNNRLVTTPAYMIGPGIKDIAPGIEKLVKKVIELA